MINFRCINRIENDDIEAIIGEKYNPSRMRLTRLKVKITNRYINYTDLESQKRIPPTPFRAREKEAMISLYSSKTKTASKIVEEVLKNLNPIHSNYCLYCGIGEIDEIDHYLPQEHFPEFSILHKNLVPICGRCNKYKDDNIPGQNNKDYLHLIYDTLPTESIIGCKITYTDNLPAASFMILPKFSSSVFNTHFVELHLKERFEEKSIQYFVQIAALKDAFGYDYALEEINRDLKKLTTYFGPCYWKCELICKMLETNFVSKIK